MEIEVYSDEIFIKDYIGIGCLFVPLSKKDRLSKYLSNLRCLNSNSQIWNWNFDDCDNDKCKKEWHINNDCEIHHANLRKDASVSKKKISKKMD